MEAYARCDTASFCHDGRIHVEVKAWVALLAPKGTPQPIVERIDEAIGKVLADLEIRERFAAFAFEPLSTPVGAISRVVEADSRRYAQIIRHLKISLDSPRGFVGWVQPTEGSPTIAMHLAVTLAWAKVEPIPEPVPRCFDRKVLHRSRTRIIPRCCAR